MNRLAARLHTQVNKLAQMAVPPELAKRLERAAKNAGKWKHERDQLIIDAYEAGGGVREIGRLVGLSHPGILRIIRQQEPGTQPRIPFRPPPKDSDV